MQFIKICFSKKYCILIKLLYILGQWYNFRHFRIVFVQDFICQTRYIMKPGCFLSISARLSSSPACLDISQWITFQKRGSFVISAFLTTLHKNWKFVPILSAKVAALNIFVAGTKSLIIWVCQSVVKNYIRQFYYLENREPFSGFGYYQLTCFLELNFLSAENVDEKLINSKSIL